jgi:hypothetical protein
MIHELAARLRRVAERGVRLPFDWLKNILDDDEDLTRSVLTLAGFRPPESIEWYSGKGAKTLADVCYPTGLADDLTDILDDYD